jgi:NADH:ubiquinone oxidoreductase subunit 6 (subunit J)
MRTAYAVETDVQPISSLPFENVGDVFGWIINIVIYVGWGLTFVMLALGFIKYITSRGETKATDSARNWLTFAAIGGVGLLLLTILKTIFVDVLDVNENNIDANFDPFGAD